MGKYLTEKQAVIKALRFKVCGVGIEELKLYTKAELKKVLLALNGNISELDTKEILRNKILDRCK